MVRTLFEERAVKIPKDVNVFLEGKSLKVKGALGELSEDFSHAPLEIKISGNAIIVKTYWAGKKEKALVGTIASHIKNMFKGISQGYVYKLKKVYSHFPINIKVSGNKVLIENFIGERRPRSAKIVGNAKVEIKGDDIEVTGLNLRDVSQTAANIQSATKIKKKDPRVFLDGIYIYEKK